jgi:hypothetical protein
MCYIKYGILLYDFCTTRFVLCKANKIVQFLAYRKWLLCEILI